MAKRVEKPSPGVNFPPGPKGDRSTTEAGKGLFAAAVGAVDKEAGAEVAKKWGRKSYARYVAKNVEVSLRSSEKALAIAEAGLKWAHDNFEFIRPEDEKTVQFSEEMRTNTKKTFKTGVVRGTQPKPTSFEISVPYKGKDLKGDELLGQIEKWVRSGVIEFSCGAAMMQAVKNKEWLDLSDQYFVLLGASSAMGPLLLLLSLGANVIAVDIGSRPGGGGRPWNGPLPGNRDGLIKAAKDSCGTLTFPLPEDMDDKAVSDIASEFREQEIFDKAGCNLLTQPAEIRNWLMGLYPGKRFTVGAYAYLDAAIFVKLSMSMDGIIKSLTEERKPASAIAYLCTPTDAHMVPAAAKDATRSNLGRAPLWQHLLSPFKLAIPNKIKAVESEDDGVGNLYFTDCIVNNQGPNYITAKRIQHWRSMVARERHSCIVSTNIAPSTATASVVSNRSFAWAYNGMHHFKPMEVFQQETSNAVMGTLLIHDISNPNCVANPATKLRHPMELFADGSFHGGAWRVGFKFDTIGIPSALAYFVGGIGLTQYLTAYNMLQAVGWLYMSMTALQAYMTPTFDATSNSTWSVVGPSLSFFQNLALLECVHSILGFVASPWHSTLLQIVSRIFVVALYNWIPEISNSTAIYILAVCWGITEVTRYSWYAMNLQGIKIKPFTYFRYSTFLVLYPFGVFGELLSIWHALPAMAGKYATGSDNPYFVQYALLPACSSIGMRPDNVMSYIVFPVYAVGLAYLYSYMLSQRSRAIARIYPAAPKPQKAKKND